MMIDTLKLKEALDAQDTSKIAEILGGADMSDFATKGDLTNVEAALKSDIAELRAATKTDIAEVETRLTNKLWTLGVTIVGLMIALKFIP